MLPNSDEESAVSWPYRLATLVDPSKSSTKMHRRRIKKKALFVLTKGFLQFIQSDFDQFLYGTIGGALKDVINYFLRLSSWVTKDLQC